VSAELKLISTDFDGTLFAEFEDPPIPLELQRMIAELQANGVKWVINTGREMASLMEALARAEVAIEPDYLILVEREIYCHEESSYLGLDDWNTGCTKAHTDLFEKIHGDLPKIVEWISTRFHARIYQDPYSPFCLIAGSNGDADVIHRYLDDYSRTVPDLVVVRNDVYARFSHSAYNKGTALAELSRRLEISRENVFATGDHLNDLPMLSVQFAKWLAAPCNAVEEVKACIKRQNGFVSEQSHGRAIVEAFRKFAFVK
jgi:hydroxymethylpyrimidine pyrophosphatase-like HAD family hydrolase